MKAQNNITEMVFILDRSGSMHGLENDTIGGFNAMIEKQKKESGEAYVTTILFDHEYKVLHDRIDLENVPTMTEQDYTVGGCTALLDAVGQAISHISDIHKYIRPEDVPAHTLFVITTDGMENTSCKFNYPAVKEMIEAKQKLGWEFLFIGANIDAAAEAVRMGIHRENAANYAADEVGTGVVFNALTESVSRIRKVGKIDKNWSKKIEADKKRRHK